MKYHESIQGQNQGNSERVLLYFYWPLDGFSNLFENVLNKATALAIAY